MEDRHKYEYDGPVYEFDTCVLGRWQASTIAVSEEKARSNIAFQYKRDFRKPVRTPIKLPGKLKKI